MKLLQVADAVRYERMTTDEIREAFLADELAIPGSLELRYIDLDRTVVGFAVPTSGALFEAKTTHAGTFAAIALVRGAHMATGIGGAP